MLPGVGSDFGRYRIVGRLGRGGMGVVFAAVHQDLQRDVALKLLSPDLADDEGYRHRFLREARALARLDSPHVIRVYDAGEHDEWLFIATELVAGGDLSNRIETQGPMPVAEALTLLAGAADGLAAAHAAGVLHRDVKPSNLLLKTLRDGSVRGVLCDFGIAAVEDFDATRTQGLIGTPAYLAPERHEGGGASVAADIYAMGCVLWACITGAAPYLGTPSQVLMGHLRGELPQVSAANPYGSAVNGILAMTLAKDPERRFRSASALASALRSSARAVASAGETTGGIEPTIVKTFAPSPTPPPPPAWPPTPLGHEDPPTQAAYGVPPAGFSGPVAPAPPPTQRPPSPGGGRSPWRVVAAAAAVALLLGAATTGAVLLSRGDDSPQDSAGADTSTDTASDRGSDRASDGTDRTQPPPTPVDDVTCWNGMTTSSAQQCPDPSGVAGLEWMYPSFDRRECGPKRLPYPRLTVWQCPKVTAAGDPVLIRYTEWQSAALADASYASKDRGSHQTFIRSADGDVVRTVWRYDGFNREGRVTLSSVYHDWPFSVSVEGASQRAIDDGLRELVLQRKPDHVLTR
ncbi:serine/threonine-protein kinase [Nocardioides sp. MH1]|uniref:serine/threonine-protein kinase n=1 Tax=Nocardioides sp. MH1 TaxID=3242490 RepID=UPI0035216A8A